MEDTEFVKWALKIGKVALIVGIVLSVLLVSIQITETPKVQERDMPEIKWEVVRINSTHISIEHVSGDSIRADSILITVEGRGRPIGGIDFIKEGDTIVTQAYEGTLIEIFWEQENEYLRLMSRSRI
tara:strand:- start:381 stop:761 length:381 start_codon:yes stop_codon:yes gene_type:complete